MRIFTYMVTLAGLFAPAVLATPAPAAVVKASASLDEQRKDYFAAQEALRARDLKRFQQLQDRLRDYLLHGYLEYELLKDRVATTPPAQLREFLRAHADAPIADQIRRKWLHHLADRGDWATFMEEYRDLDDDHELRCRRLGHLLRAGNAADDTAADLRKLWLTGNRLPAVCEEVFSQWNKTGGLDSALVWQRIRLAMERRNLSFAEHLANFLDSKDRVWVRRWTAVHRDPARELSKIDFPVETELARTIVAYGVMRLGQRDPQVAMEEWNRLKRKFSFSESDEHYVMRSLGLLAAQGHLPLAAEWLAAVPAAQDENARHWRVRAAMRAEQWALANSFIAALTPGEQAESQWRYWRARVWQKLGMEAKAQEALRALAAERGYYGFLAADRIGKDYSMQHVGVAVTPEEVSAMLARRGIQLAQELFAIGETIPARRQWAFATKRMSNRELQVAAVIAAQWGWYDRAILTMSRTDNLDDLELRFPLLYRQMVEASAEANRIDPAWVYGVMRQESAFVSDARSPAGALGLMQLMPQTGRSTGRALKLSIKNDDAILRIENNLRLGAHYLRLVLDQHRGHPVLATAAYNAGPNRLKDWLPKEEPLDADIWIDTIPFTETRNYVKNVLAFTTVYNHRLGLVATRMQQRMPPVTPRG